MDRAAVRDLHVGVEHHVRLHQNVPSQHRVVAQENRFGCGKRRATEHRIPAQAGLDHRLGGGELHPVVDALRLRLGDVHHGHVEAVRDGQRHGVGQVVLAGRIVVADPRQQPQGMGAGERHQPGIAQAHGALGCRGVLLLADRQHPAALRQHPAVAGGRLGREGQHRHRRPLGQRRPQAGQGLGRDERRVAEGDHHVVVARLQGRAGGQHRVGRAEALALRVDGGTRRLPLDLGGHVRAAGLGHHGHAAGAGRLHRGEHVAEHAAAGDGVQHLRQVGAHPRALAGGQHDRREAALDGRAVRDAGVGCGHAGTWPSVRDGSWRPDPRDG
ncbi:hypothetical protein MPOCJGCO_4108 [Methylobacterium trifolii]|uniref:Uncharacterized protein n=1 Tax=Methylobacterium trifolii TaxID=1003092 RepID=A0ABQ4U749_9HYPH|nr:hypothetical protein MPOCJGCO_4108 [Methylobacterium trifolii]